VTYPKPPNFKDFIFIFGNQIVNGPILGFFSVEILFDVENRWRLALRVEEFCKLRSHAIGIACNTN
jgi:hypothetical protein